jgi:hypothetical protein
MTSELHDEPTSASYTLHVRQNVPGTWLQEQDTTIRSFD